MIMEEKLRKHIDSLFADTEPSKDTAKLKEEMRLDLETRYNNLVFAGTSPDAAYRIAISGIGGASGLAAKKEASAMNDTLDVFRIESARRKFAMISAIAAVVYALSVLPLVMLTMADSDYARSAGWPVFLILAGGATAMLIFFHNRKPRYYNYSKASYKLITGFSDWQKNTNKRTVLRRAISATLWTVLSAAYIIISFMTYAWSFTWVIFILGVALEAIINLIFTVFITLKEV